jgi:hypothetical protein
MKYRLSLIRWVPVLAGSVVFLSCSNFVCKKDNNKLALYEGADPDAAYVSAALQEIRRYIHSSSVSMASIRNDARKLHCDVWGDSNSDSEENPIVLSLEDPRIPPSIKRLNPTTIHIWNDSIAVYLYEDEWIWALLVIGLNNDYVVPQKRYYQVLNVIVPGVWYNEVDHSIF